MSWEAGGDSPAYRLHPSASLMFRKLGGPLGGSFLEQHAGNGLPGCWCWHPAARRCAGMKCQPWGALPGFQQELKGTW